MMKSVKIQTTIEHTALGNFLPDNIEIILIGYKVGHGGDYSYTFEGAEIFKNKEIETKPAKLDRDYLDLFFEGCSDELEQNMIELDKQGELERSIDQAEYDYELRQEAR